MLGPRPFNLVQIKTAAIGSSEKVHRSMTNVAGLTAGNARWGRGCYGNGGIGRPFRLGSRLRYRICRGCPEVRGNVLGFPVRVPVHKCRVLGARCQMA